MIYNKWLDPSIKHLKISSGSNVSRRNVTYIPPTGTITSKDEQVSFVLPSIPIISSHLSGGYLFPIDIKLSSSYRLDEIHYRINDGNYSLYTSEGIHVDNPCTISFFGVRLNELITPVYSVTYTTKVYEPIKLVISPISETSYIRDIIVDAFSYDNNSSIYYSTDGFDPSSQSIKYINPVHITEIGNYIYRFIAINNEDHRITSDILTGYYSIGQSAGPPIPEPCIFMSTVPDGYVDITSDLHWTCLNYSDNSTVNYIPSYGWISDAVGDIVFTSNGDWQQGKTIDSLMINFGMIDISNNVTTDGYLTIWDQQNNNLMPDGSIIYTSNTPEVIGERQVSSFNLYPVLNYGDNIHTRVCNIYCKFSIPRRCDTIYPPPAWNNTVNVTSDAYWIADDMMGETGSSTYVDGYGWLSYSGRTDGYIQLRSTSVGNINKFMIVYQIINQSDNQIVDIAGTLNLFHSDENGSTHVNYNIGDEITVTNPNSLIGINFTPNNSVGSVYTRVCAIYIDERVGA